MNRQEKERKIVNLAIEKGCAELKRSVETRFGTVTAITCFGELMVQEMEERVNGSVTGLTDEELELIHKQLF